MKNTTVIDRIFTMFNAFGAVHYGEEVTQMEHILQAAYLAPYFPPSVTDPVRLHVDAKRYLCSAEPGYREALSRASELSLRLQGGPFNQKEMNDFMASPGAESAIRLRRYDDLGKRQAWQVPDLESYRPLLESLLLR